MRLIKQLKEKSRFKKYEQFMEFCNPTKKNLVLDVGVTDTEFNCSDNQLERSYPFRQNITGLGIWDLTEFSKRYPGVKAVTYDGKRFPFKDNSFDYLWSNAVIEHVGNRGCQELFLAEIFRVTKKKIFFTTPDRGFPVELHTQLPFVHWLPKKISDILYIKVQKKWAAGNYMHLLYKKDLEKLLDKMKQKYSFKYQIMKNRLFGFNVTFSVLVSLDKNYNP